VKEDREGVEGGGYKERVDYIQREVPYLCVRTREADNVRGPAL
jgi:hypothetical protein